jgi:hypothetical protein
MRFQERLLRGVSPVPDTRYGIRVEGGGWRVEGGGWRVEGEDEEGLNLLLVGMRGASASDSHSI